MMQAPFDCARFGRLSRPHITPKQVSARSWQTHRCQATPGDTLSNGLNFNIHGRHVDVTPELEQYVKNKLSSTLHKFQGAEYLEGEGSIENVDVRLMNIKADIKVHPRFTDKEVHDTYLRMGELKAERYGKDVYESFDNAAEALDRKLHKWKKATPKKMNLRVIGKRMGRSSIPPP